MSEQKEHQAQSRAKTLLVVSQNTTFCRDRLPKVLQTPKVVVQAVNTSLADAKATVLAQQPDLILFEKSFAAQPDFDEFLKLIGTHSINWMTIPEHDKRPCAPIADGTPKLRAHHPKKPVQEQGPSLAPRRSLVLLGTSTGGVDALTTILKDYPANCPPTLIVQHTGEIFGDGLIDVLKNATPANVIKATHDLHLKPGMVCIAAGGKNHLRMSPKMSSRIELASGEKISGHIPSIDALFHSATHVAKIVVAGILTGMGKDGVAGLAALRAAGATTFSQDQASSTVYGMPKQAWTTGAAQQQVSLEDVTAHIMSKTNEIEIGGLVE